MPAIPNLYKKIAGRIDLPFLLFLLTISSNKIYLKAVALVLIFALRPKFNFLFTKKISFFYPFLIILTTVQFLFFGHDFSANHILAFLVGIFYWFTCYAYMYQTYLFVDTNSRPKINDTLAVFLYLNFAFCLFNYFQVCYKAGTLLPFLQNEGNYGASTGDYIVGLFGAPSYINSMICSLLALQFLHTKKAGLFFLATFCSLLSFANIVNLIFVALLIIYGIFSGDNKKRVFVVANIVLCLLMYIYISPGNYNYMRKTIGLSVNDETEIMPEVVVDKQVGDKTKKPPQHLKYVNDSSAAGQKIFMADRGILFKRNFEEYPTYYPADIKSSPGKKIAVLQTFSFLRDNPSAAIFGAGVGNFSSRLAFQFSGRDDSRLFSRVPKYCNGYYFKNNLLIYDVIISLPTEYHSIKHFPNNFISQLLGEYGLAGLIIFVVFYFYYYYRKQNNTLFFLTIFFCTGAFLMLDYIFEYFNVMVIFELLLMINLKQDEAANTLPGSDD